MYRFFINRPIVAMVIAIMMVLVGVVSMLTLPIAQFPEHRAAGDPHPGHITSARTRQTMEQSIATPIEEQMSGVDNMNYMYSINANNGVMRMVVNFDVKTDPNMDQMLAQLREAQAEPQLPADVRNYGVTLLKSPTTPMMLDLAVFAEGDARRDVPGQLRLYQSGRPDHPGAGHFHHHGFRRRPVRDALLGQTRPTGQAEHHGQRHHQRREQPEHGESRRARSAGRRRRTARNSPMRSRAQGRLVTAEEFGNIVIRENPDGSTVRLKDVARVELGAQLYTIARAFERQTGGHDGHLPTARVQRHRRRQGGPEAAWMN